MEGATVLATCTKTVVFDAGLSALRVSENRISETVRKGVRVASEASILVVSSNKIELLGRVSAVFEASVRSLSGLFGQSLSAAP
jgi:hypothetical protein